MDQE